MMLHNANQPDEIWLWSTRTVRSIQRNGSEYMLTRLAEAPGCEVWYSEELAEFFLDREISSEKPDKGEYASVRRWDSVPKDVALFHLLVAVTPEELTPVLKPLIEPLRRRLNPSSQ